MKVYLFYYKKELYAFTVTKRRREAFLQERGKDKITEKIVKMTDSEYSTFSYEMHNKLLVEIPLSDGNRHTSLIGTYEEEEKMSYRHDSMMELSEDCIRAIQHIPFTQEVRELLLEMVNCRNMLYDSNINTFDLFVDMFHDTFSM